MASRKGSFKEQKEQERCGQCNKMVTDKDSGVLCEICESWFHTSCEGISEEVYKVLCRSDILHWFCKRCSLGALKTLKSVGRLIEKVDVLEERIVAMQSETQREIQELKHSFEEIDDAVRNVVDAKLTGEVKKNVEQHVTEF